MKNGGLTTLNKINLSSIGPYARVKKTYLVLCKFIKNSPEKSICESQLYAKNK